MSVPYVSVIMPSSNSADYIEESITSVLTQSHPNLELIVVDDGSTDNTLDIIRTLATQDSRIKVIARNECSGGPATPRNEGLEVSSGDFLAFIDSDDVWHQQKLELQLRAMQVFHLNFVSSLHTPFTDTSPDTTMEVDAELRVTALSHTGLLHKNTVVTSSALIERETFEGVQFDTSDALVGVEDYLAWLQLHQQANIRSAVLLLPLVNYRCRADSLSNSKLRMAIKVYTLLSHYRPNNKSLGAAKYYYFLAYAFASLKARVRRS